MLANIKGRIAWIFHEDNYDIDNIIGVENIKIKDVDALKEVCMKSYDENFINDVKVGDVLVAGHNFGYGHPHWGAFIAMRALGIKAVFAESFYPGFYRGETGNGFALVEVPGIIEKAKRWDTLSYDWEGGIVKINSNTTLQSKPVPQKTKDLVECGGLIEYLKEKRLK